MFDGCASMNKYVIVLIPILMNKNRALSLGLFVSVSLMVSTGQSFIMLSFRGTSSCGPTFHVRRQIKASISFCFIFLLS